VVAGRNLFSVSELRAGTGQPLLIAFSEVTCMNMDLLKNNISAENLQAWQVCSTWHTWHTGFWWGNPTEVDHLEDPDVDGRKYWNGSSRSGVGRHGLDWSDL